MIDFAKLLKFAVLELKIAPSEFWQLTLKEFLAIAGVDEQNQMISSNELQQLQKQFPD